MKISIQTNDVKLKISQLCKELGENQFLSICRENYEIIGDIANLYDDNECLLMTMSADNYFDEIWLDMPEFKQCY